MERNIRLRKIEFEISRCPELETTLHRMMKERGDERMDIFFRLVRERGSELVEKIRASGKSFEDFFDETVSERIVTIRRRDEGGYSAETCGRFPKYLETGESVIEALGRLLLSMMCSLDIEVLSVHGEKRNEKNRKSFVASTLGHYKAQSTGPSPAAALGTLLRQHSSFFGVIIEKDVV